ncbi:MAG: Eco57I restriction-modification methylase domain-containing protein [Pseudoramibacter sp.]
MEPTRNFEFLKNSADTAPFYSTARDIEALYTNGQYAPEAVTVRKIAENLAKTIAFREHLELPERATFNDTLKVIRDHYILPPAMVEFLYRVKKIGNLAAHEMGDVFSKDNGLKLLRACFQLLAWYANRYCGGKVAMAQFGEPVRRTTYQTFDKKLIYIQTADGSPEDWPLYQNSRKIGDATLTDPETDARANSDDLRQAAKERIRQYMTTSGVPYKVEWAELAYSKATKHYFRDYDVRNVLYRSGIKRNEKLTGDEWLLTDLDTAKAAITAVKNGQSALNLTHPEMPEIHLRPEQQEAVTQTKRVFKKKDRMLWNAKMRFGKTLTALELVKEEKFSKVLIMTHRPVVSDSWFDDFGKMHMAEAGYAFGSKGRGEPIQHFVNCDTPFVYFASIQDLRGSAIFGGKAGDKNREFEQIPWDLIIIDEAHEGTQTELAQNVIDGIKGKDTKVLELSGTPFNLIDQYDSPEAVYTWDYVMEQRAKYNWDLEHPGQPNPYAGLPKVEMYVFDIGKDFKNKGYTDVLDKKSFNFREFFRVDDETGKFVHEKDVWQFLNNITDENSETHYPFSTDTFRDRLRHTLWILPGVKEAAALEALMCRHPVFGPHYRIVNVVKNDTRDDVAEASEGDLARVRAAIGDDPGKTRTVTLTVRKLTTGVNVPEWTGVVFLSNTSSAMQYLQAAFRAQTPFACESLGQKEICYIFDFAPDRALTVMAESTQLSTGLGKRIPAQKKREMADLLNFLPIIGKTGNRMRPYSVDKLLTQVKRVYAEKAVRTGFDDDSIYSDELLMLKEGDLKDFNDLKAIVGTSKKEKAPVQIDITKLGLTNEEYDEIQDVHHKPKKERTEEEEALLEKERELKAQRKTMISILRGISIRIPMLIYGMDIDLAEDVTIQAFPDLVDDVSWAEFMPKGVSKAMFKKFIKYYDGDVFIEAGRIIRRRVQALDHVKPVERVKQLAQIFATFRNPDKETVLTPWRVVNLQCGKTIGGLSFYDETYQHTTEGAKDARHWVRTAYTDQVFGPKTRILEINAKTGLYPLYAAVSLYHKEAKGIVDSLGKITERQAENIWKRILKNNIFVIAKTPMAAHIAERTLTGYQKTMPTNIHYVENIVEAAREDAKAAAEQIKEDFNTVKFDCVIGNPPYQDVSKGDNDTFTPPIYNSFMDLSYQLSDLVTLITPARFLFNAGSTPKDWNRKMLHDPHFKIVYYVGKSAEVFPRTDIKGGVVITLRDANKDFGSISKNYAPAGIFVPFKELHSVMHKVFDKKEESFSNIVYPRTIYKFTEKLHEDYPNARKKLSKGHAYDVSSNIFDRLPEVFFEEKPDDNNQYIQIVGRKKAKRVTKYIRKDYVEETENLGAYKVFVPAANGSGALGETVSTPMIGEPMIGSTETFMSIGNFSTREEAEACDKYIKTKFARVLLGVLKITQHNPVSTWKCIPMQDFSSNSDIDWSKPVAEIDQQLYAKYGLSDEETAFIEEKVQAMD